MADRLRRHVPDELKKIPHWVACDRRQRLNPKTDLPIEGSDANKSSKAPLNPNPTHPRRTDWDYARSDAPATWGSFEQALAYALKHPKLCGGIGFNLKGTNYLALDPDGVMATTETQQAYSRWFRNATGGVGTYTEVSPSGTGLRLLYKGKRPNGVGTQLMRNEFGDGTKLEVFDHESNRYVTITGDVLGAGPSPIADLPQELADALKLAAKKPKRAPNAPRITPNDHDYERLRWALLACDPPLLDPDMPEPDWFKVICGLKTFGHRGEELAIEWSQMGDKFVSVDDVRGKFDRTTNCTVSSVFGMLDDAHPGWRHACPAHDTSMFTEITDEDIRALDLQTHDNTRTTDELLEQRYGTSAIIERWQREGALSPIPTGIEQLDLQLEGGFRPGTMWSHAGEPNQGKTHLFGFVAFNMLKANCAVGWLAADEPPERLLTRFMQRLGYSRADVEARRADVLSVGRKQLSKLPLFLFGRKESIERAAKRTIRLAKMRNSSQAVLVLDSLQTVRCEAELAADSALRNISDTQRINLRLDAIESLTTGPNRLLVMFTSEMPRSAYANLRDAEDRNQMASGKGSGNIEYAAETQTTQTRLPQDSGSELRVVKTKWGRAHAPGKTGLALRLDSATQDVRVNDSLPEGEDRKQRSKDLQSTDDMARVIDTILRDESSGKIRSARSLRERMDALGNHVSRDRAITAWHRLRDEFEVGFEDANSGKNGHGAPRLRIEQLRDLPDTVLNRLSSAAVAELPQRVAEVIQTLQSQPAHENVVGGSCSGEEKRRTQRLSELLD